MTLRSDCPLLPFFFSCYLFLSTLILLFPGSFLLIFLLCLHPFSYFIVSWLVWAALLGYFFGLYGLFFPWLVLNKTKSSRLHSGVVPCCILLPYLIHLGSDDKNFAESAPDPHAHSCFPLLFQPFVILFLFLFFCPCLLVTALPASRPRLFDRWGRV